MINLFLFRHLGESRIARIAGVRWEKVGNGDLSHFDEKIITDEIQSAYIAGKDGKKAVGKVFATIRYFNFMWCLARVLKTKRDKTMCDEIVNEALDLAEKSCFSKGEPINIAAGADMAYSKFMKTVEADLSAFNA